MLSTLRWFREEYEAHVFERRCPAGACTELLNFRIVADKCKGCTLCGRKCPVGAIMGAAKSPHYIIPDKCVKCGTCIEGSLWLLSCSASFARGVRAGMRASRALRSRKRPGDGSTWSTCLQRTGPGRQAGSKRVVQRTRILRRHSPCSQTLAHPSPAISSRHGSITMR